VPDNNAYVFFSRNTGIYGKMSQTAVNKRLRYHAAIAHLSCKDVPLDIHAHQLRHARASHWLEEGVNLLQISFLLGHESLETTQIYLDITTEQDIEALATLEDENDKKITKKWNSGKGTLASFCGM
jgi:site-specific recombinase XerD